MKNFKIVLLAASFGLLATSCGETTTDETTTADSMNTTTPADNTGGGITGGGMTDTTGMSMPDTTVGDTLR